MADNMSYEPVEARPARVSKWRWLSVLGTVLFWVAPFVILGSIAGALTGELSIPGSLAGFLCSWLLLLVVVSLDGSVRRSRRRNGEILLGYVEAAVRLNLPIRSFLLSARIGESGRRSIELGAIVDALEAGKSVGAALRTAPDIPADAVARIAAAEPLGQLRLALTSEIERQQEADGNKRWWRETAFYRFYPIVLMLIFIGFLVFVLPKYRVIFKDFQVELPLVTTVVVRFSIWFVGSGVVTAAVVLVSMVIVLFAVEVGGKVVILRRLRELRGWMAWRLPFFHGMQRDRGMADCCRLLAAAVRNGVPLEEAVSRSLELPINNGLRRPLALFQRELAGGALPADAARRAGLPALIAGVLMPLSTRAVGESGEMFEFLAAYYRQRFSRTVQLLRAGAEPAMVLAAGCLVLSFVLAMFLPLVKLIDSVSGNGGGAL